MSSSSRRRQPVGLALLLVLLAVTVAPSRAFQALSVSPLQLTRRSVSTLSPTSNRFKLPEKNAAASPTALYSGAAITTVFAALDSFWQTSPYAAAGLICGFKASAADYVAQKRDFRKRAEKERKKAEKAAAEAAQAAASSEAETQDVNAVIYNPDYNEDGTLSAGMAVKKADWKRNAAFLIYGALYQGITQEHVYNHLYPVWFGSGTSVSIVATKVLFDLLIQTTLLTLPIAYLTKSVIYRYSFKEAIRRYLDDIRNHGLLKKYYLLWGPVQCLTFGVVPEHYRVTFIAFVSFFWLIILSTIASKTANVVPAVVKITSGGKDNDECSLEDGLTCNIDG